MLSSVISWTNWTLRRQLLQCRPTTTNSSTWWTSRQSIDTISAGIHCWRHENCRYMALSKFMKKLVNMMIYCIVAKCGNHDFSIISYLLCFEHLTGAKFMKLFVNRHYVNPDNTCQCGYRPSTNRARQLIDLTISEASN